MKEILDRGKVCQLGDILFVQYRTSKVLTEYNTFYLNKLNGKTINFFTPSVTQWHWNPSFEARPEELIDILMNAEEIITCQKHSDMWFDKKMAEVIPLLQ